MECILVPDSTDFPLNNQIDYGVLWLLSQLFESVTVTRKCQRHYVNEWVQLCLLTKTRVSWTWPSGCLCYSVRQTVK